MTVVNNKIGSSSHGPVNETRRHGTEEFGKLVPGQWGLAISEWCECNEQSQHAAMQYCHANLGVDGIIPCKPVVEVVTSRPILQRMHDAEPDETGGRWQPEKLTTEYADLGSSSYPCHLCNSWLFSLMRGARRTPRRQGWDIAWMARETARQARQTRPITFASFSACRAVGWSIRG